MSQEEFCSNPECPFHYPAAGNTQTAVINGVPKTVHRYVIKSKDLHFCGTCMKVFEIFNKMAKEVLTHDA